MVSSKVILTLALVCVALVPAYAAVTKCLVCTSTTTTPNTNCLYGNATATSCTAGTTFEHCVKEIINEGENNEMVKRSCGTEKGYECTKDYSCYFCDEDECNSSVTISKSVPVIGLSLVAAYLLSRFNH